MGRWIGIAVAALVTTVATSTPAWSSPSLPDRGMLEGVVTSARVGLAVPNASVTLRSTTSDWFDVRTTDRDGWFKFENLPAGLYSLEARADLGLVQRGLGVQQALVSPVLVVPGLPVTENVVLEDVHPPVAAGPST